MDMLTKPQGENSQDFEQDELTEKSCIEKVIVSSPIFLGNKEKTKERAESLGYKVSDDFEDKNVFYRRHNRGEKVKAVLLFHVESNLERALIVKRGIVYEFYRDVEIHFKNQT